MSPEPEELSKFEMFRRLEKRHAAVTPNQKLVLFALTWRANYTTRQCTPGYGTLASDTLLGKSTVKKVIKELRLLPEIEVTHRYFRDGDACDTNSYVLLFLDRTESEALDLRIKRWGAMDWSSHLLLHVKGSSTRETRSSTREPRGSSPIETRVVSDRAPNVEENGERKRRQKPVAPVGATSSSKRVLPEDDSREARSARAVAMLLEDRKREVEGEPNDLTAILGNEA